MTQWALCVWAAVAVLLCQTTLWKKPRTTFVSLFQDVKWNSGGFDNSMLSPVGLWCLMAGEAPQLSGVAPSGSLWVSSGHFCPRCCPKADPGTLTDEFYGLLACPGVSWGSGPLCSTEQLSSVTQMIYDGAITTLPFLVDAQYAFTSRRRKSIYFSPFSTSVLKQGY